MASMALCINNDTQHGEPAQGVARDIDLGTSKNGAELARDLSASELATLSC